MSIYTKCSLWERLQVTYKAVFSFSDISTHIHTFGCHIRQRVTFIHIKIGSSRNRRNKSHIVVYPVQVNIDRFQIALSQTSFFTTRISRNYFFVCSYSLIIFIILIIQQTYLICCPTRKRTFRITLNQKRITLYSIIIVFQLHESTSLFIKCIIQIL